MQTEIYEVGFWGRVRYAFKAWWHIMALRPTFIAFDDEEMYARTNVQMLAQMTAVLMDMTEQAVVGIEAEEWLENLIKNTENRKN